MSDMNLNYEQDVEIDSEALDVEWINQPSLMYKYAKHAAEMKQQMDDAKEKTEVVKARLDKDVRNDPSKYGLKKITETAIQGAITLMDEYQDVYKDYSDARYEYGVSMAAVNATDQRKSALENLVKLLCASYFAGPQAPRDLSQEYLAEKERKIQNAKVTIKQPSKSGKTPQRRRRKES